MSLWGELRRRNVFKVAAAYALVAWIVAQVVGLVIEPLRLPAVFLTGVLVLLAVGFPLALLFAWAFELTPSGLKRTVDVAPGQSVAHVTGQKLNYLVIGLLIGAVVGSSGAWFLARDSDARWAREEAVPRLESIVEQGQWEAAYSLAKEIRDRAPGDRDLEQLWPRFSRPVSITTEPPGARVYRLPYKQPDGEWELLGTTPLERVRVPIGVSRIRLEREGFRSQLRLVAFSVLGGAPHSEQVLDFGPIKLDTAETLPEGKVRVSGCVAPIAGETPLSFEDFFIDRYEVTNREYKEFVDAGGYERPEYWRHAIVDDGRELSWEEAMRRFRDRTEQPGPSTWQAGDYADGHEDYPVGGVSWYEAAAYAEFAGEELPPVHHRRCAAGDPPLMTWLLPYSNLGSEGPAAVGEFEGVSPPGAYDMLGNVREWTFNAIGDRRVILGGGWKDPYYLAGLQDYAQPPMNRDATNGFRLAITRDGSEVTAAARRELPASEAPDYSVVQHVSDEVFAAYEDVFAYDDTPLEAAVEASIDTRAWVRERITFDAAYGDERVTLYLYLPRASSPPYQTVVFVPGINAWSVPSLDEYAFHLDFLVRDGRAVAWPVYKGTFERRDELGLGYRRWDTLAGRDRVIEVMQDLGRSLDYLETRRDIDGTKLGYYGWSIGGMFAPLALALEPRLRAAALTVGGFSSENFAFRDDIDPGRYLSRVEQPVLMMNGELDSLVPLETHARPFFERFGTAAEHKRLVTAEGGHYVPRVTLTTETLAWFDEHFGVPSR